MTLYVCIILTVYGHDFIERTKNKYLKIVMH